jgi:hypothetical protein
MGSSRRRNSTRARKARSVETPSPTTRPPTVQADRCALAGIRDRVAIAVSVAYVCSAALAAQGGDSDRDATTALQRCVGDALTAEVEKLDRLIAGGAS